MKSPVPFFLLLLAQSSWAQVDSLIGGKIPFILDYMPYDWRRDSLAVEAIYKENSIEEYATAWMDLGEKCFELHDSFTKNHLLNYAATSFRKVLSLDSANHEAWFSLGKTHWLNLSITGLGDYSDRAIECFQKAVKLKPDNYEAYEYLGYLYFRRLEYALAIDCFTQSLKPHPTYSLPYSGRGRARYAQGDLEREAGRMKEAKRLYKNALKDFRKSQKRSSNTRHEGIFMREISEKLSSLRD